MYGELKAAGIKFIMRVIGFDVTQEEEAQLECMAEAGGGRYFTAKNAVEFQTAVKEVVKETQDFGYLKITALRNGEPVRARIDVFPQDAQGQKRSGTSGTTPEREGFRLHPGVYDVHVTDTEATGKPSVRIQGLEVVVGMTTEKAADFTGAGLEITSSKHGKPIKAYVTIYRQGEKKQVRAGWLPKEG
jgi:Ca-activated chloride channel family protein